MADDTIGFLPQDDTASRSRHNEDIKADEITLLPMRKSFLSLAMRKLLSLVMRDGLSMPMRKGVLALAIDRRC